jgi:hypothetical protein
MKRTAMEELLRSPPPTLSSYEYKTEVTLQYRNIFYSIHKYGYSGKILAVKKADNIIIFSKLDGRREKLHEEVRYCYIKIRVQIGENL